MADAEQERPLWWQSGVVYQIYPRSFQDASGDGIGDLRGVLARLDYLSDTLGVEAIWLSPFFPSPMHDFGYDVSDYCDVHPMFGTLAEFDELVAAAHARGMKVIIDYVPNHCSIEHPWFVEARASRDNPKRDWFYWRDAAPDGGPPNNWMSPFGGSAWQWDDETQQYFLHIFLPEQPDLNWRNPEVKAAMLDVVRFWMERDVDGLRIDALHYLMKDPQWRDNPRWEGERLTHKPMGEYEHFQHVHTTDHPDIHPILQELRGVLDEYSAERPRVAIGEVHVFDWPMWTRYYGAQLDELHLPFNFGLLKTAWTARAVRDHVNGLEGALPPGAWPNYVVGNHDEPRIATRIGAEQARVAMLLLLTLRGTPTLYQGDELGMEDVPVPDDRQQDPWGIRVPGLGRDPERAPMLWDASANAGFAPAGAEPWLPIAPDAATRNAQAQLADPSSMLNLTRRLLALRRESDALTAGSYAGVEPVPDDVFAYLREGGDGRYLIALSFSDRPRTLALPNLGRGEIVASTRMDRDGELTSGTVDLRANEGLVLRLR